jgi:hypothetical protein
VYNGAELDSDEATAPDVQGLTVVTNQAVYVQGSYNAANKKPAAWRTTRDSTRTGAAGP